jgi:hypothetical protein
VISFETLSYCNPEKEKGPFHRHTREPHMSDEEEDLFGENEDEEMVCPSLLLLVRI